MEIQKLKEIAIGLFTKYRHFIIYSMIGVTGASLDYLTFLLFTNVFHWNIILSNVLSVTLGVTDSFVLNLLFNFKVKDKLFLRAVSFYTVGAIGMGLSTLILHIFVTDLGFNKAIVKLLSLIIVVLVQYKFNKTISFRDKKNIKYLSRNCDLFFSNLSIFSFNIS